MSSNRNRSGEGDGIALVVIVGILILGVALATEQRRIGFDNGVIAATRGTHTARLVEKADGTTEWEVEAASKGERDDHAD